MSTVQPPLTPLPTEAGPSHCVFRCGSCWLALPATAVREVLPRPTMVGVPGTPDEFVGLCHVRSEFIPVLNLRTVLPDGISGNEHIMLILEDVDGSWAVLVDEVMSLRMLEISDAPQSDPDDARNAVIGWATLDDIVVQVLDQSCIRQAAENRLALARHNSTEQTDMCPALV